MNSLLKLFSIIIGLAGITLFFSFQTPQNKTAMPPYNWDKDYSEEWEEVEAKEQDGLPKSALEIVDQIYAKAKADKNTPQLVKALLYKIKYNQPRREDFSKLTSLVEATLEEVNFPETAIIQSILGSLYSDYLDQNYWYIQDRTNTIGAPTEDVATWTIEQILEKAANYFEASLQDEALHDIAIEEIETILVEGENTKGLRPTLYDFLAHRAIDFYSNERHYAIEPAYVFQIKNAVAFGSAKAFAETEIIVKDTSSFKYKNLLLLQQLTKTHLKDKEPEALIDLELKRLRFVQNNAVNLPKDSLYLQALDLLFETYKERPMAAEILHAKATHFYAQGANYQIGDTSPNREAYKKAMSICEQAITSYPNSVGAQYCEVIKVNLLHKKLSLEIENTETSNTARLAKLSFQNIDKVYFKVVKLRKGDDDVLYEKRRDKRLNFLKRLETVLEWEQAMPVVDDYREHSTEIKINPLALGRYAILIADNPKFEDEDGVANYILINSSNLSYWSRQSADGNYEFVVANRLTGKPEPGVLVEFYTSTYSKSKKMRVPRLIGTATSDQDGFVRSDKGFWDRYYLHLTKGADHLINSSNFYDFERQAPNKTRHTTFFLDRAIYRPGQTVYFKAILIEKDEQGKPSILANEKVVIDFLDVNGQTVETLNLVSNEYGTVNGSFAAPNTGLTGYMQLRSNIGHRQKGFRVEEYKRPKFEVVFDTLSETYNLGDEVRVKGSAKAFAGSIIEGAKVQYRVVRNIQFPWFYRWNWFPTKSRTTKITNGVTETDSEGNFSIDFTALEDEQQSEAQKPMYVFSVYADITDITGETRSAVKTIRLSKIGLLIDITVEEAVDRQEKIQFPVSSTNLDGAAIPSELSVKVVALDAPNQAFKKRLWSKPDINNWSKVAFKKDFPDFAFGEEDQKESWAEKSTEFEGTINTGTTKTLELDPSDWPIGQYKITLSAKDAAGNALEQVKYFKVIDESSNSIPTDQLLWSKFSKEKYEPGEEAELILASSKPLTVLVELEKQQQKVEKKWLDLTKYESQDILKSMVKEADRGNFFWTVSYVYHNRFQNEVHTVKVPWSNKDLELSFSTFRDKLLPGVQEEWQIKISGPKKEALAAELVATMYDASLDVFAANYWNTSFFSSQNWPESQWSANSFYANSTQLYFPYPKIKTSKQYYYALDWFDGAIRRAPRGVGGGSYPIIRGSRSIGTLARSAVRERDYNSGVVSDYLEDVENHDLNPYRGGALEAKANAMAAPKGAAPPPPPAEPIPEEVGLGDVPIRTNLNETVFFMPELHTDEEGNVILKFEMNEALTKWKFMGFAHTKDLKSGYLEEEVVTQKELMVEPNAPRFVREGDEIEFTAKVSNLTEEFMDGQASLLLFDALTMKPIDKSFGNMNNIVSFSADAGQSARLAWKLKIPEEGISAITHRVVAKAGKFSDGEESAIPVLTNRMLVTETMPLAVKGKEQKTFTFNRMNDLGQSKTLKSHRYTLEFSSNPAWYAVQALPYLMEYPYDCTEQVFNRFYANSLAAHIANASPEIKTIFDSWKNTDAMESNLSKNEELKSLLLEETPWVLAAQSEEEQRKNIGLLFDLNRMGNEQAAMLQKLKDRQSGSGGFSWFPGGRESWYITQYLVEGLGHLEQLGVLEGLQQETSQLTQSAIQFIDAELVNHYKELERNVKKGQTTFEADHLDYLVIHYLYARSFFQKYEMDRQTATIMAYYLRQAEEYWLNKGFYLQGMLGLALHREKQPEVAAKIIASLRERAIYSEELGMYWEYPRGYFWHELPIETHALLTELFAEVADDADAVAQLKQWLLKHKQTNAWKTTKGTAAAVYALLNYGDDWLLESQPVSISFGETANRYNKQIEQAQAEATPGIGYFKTSWEGKAVKDKLGTVEVNNPNKGIAWGGVYWQYFEQLDKISTFEETPLQLKKQLYKEVPSDKGPQLEALADGATLVPGDKIIVRIELRVDRPMEYVHMKDMRASGLEPINVISRYKWQGGLSYYESTGDAATNFFFSYLPEGTHVFEYPLRVFYQGNFSNGVTTVQCMYAPEFTSHSEGIRIEVEE